MKGLPAWRVAVAAVILLGMALLLGAFAPVYYHNFKLQSYVGELTQRVDSKARSDDFMRAEVVDRAHNLSLPVTADDVHVTRAQDGTVQKLEVRYFVQVSLPGYSVKLHFYPGAGSR